MHQRLKITQNMVSVGAIGKKTTSQMAQESQFPSANSQRVNWQGNNRTKLVVSGVV